MAGQVRDRLAFSTLNTLVLSPISARLLPVNLGWRIKIRSDTISTGIPFASATVNCLRSPYWHSQGKNKNANPVKTQRSALVDI